MANLITMQTLKMYAPSLTNRGENNEPKSTTVGCIERSRITSQSIKKATRDHIRYNSFRSAHLPDLIEKMLLQKVEDGSIEEKQVDNLGEIICKSLCCDYKNRTSQKKNSKDKDDNVKGNTVINASPAEIIAIVNAAVSSNGDAKAIKTALDDVRVSLEKALFGAMTTGGDLETIDGAVSVGHLYGLEEMIPENDFIVASYQGASVDEGDPFYGSFSTFNEDQKAKTGGETLASSWMYSSTMYMKTSVNVKQLRNNLVSSITGKKVSIPDTAVSEEMQNAVSDYLRTIATVVPSAKKNSMLTDSFPAICYIESIKDGVAHYADPYFEKVITGTREESVTEQGIKRMLQYASGKKHLQGDVNRYVILDDLYAEYEEAFISAGITVLHDMDELATVVKKEVERLDV